MKLEMAKFQPAQPATAATVAAAANNASVSAAQAQLQISSTPDGADIEIDGNYIGSTPSNVGVPAGQHQVSIKKTGFKPWERKITVSTGQINVDAPLEPESK